MSLDLSTDPALFALALVTAVGCGTVGGVFFAFSTFVMHGLTRLAPSRGIEAMQAINASAVRPAFMAALFGTAACCLALCVAALRTWGDHRATLLLAGSVLYLLGTVLPTIVYHVPRNDELAAVDPSAPDAPGTWRRYAAGWTRWNHLRAAAAGLAAAAHTTALAV